MNIKRNNLKEFILHTNGKFFSVLFKKKDKSIRKMNCRLGVKKYLKSNKSSTTSHILKYVTVYDMTKRSYRNINVETIQTIKFNGNEYEII